MKILIFLILFYLACSQNVISRNEKVQEMIKELSDNQQKYDQLISVLEQKLNNDYENCVNEINNQNCSDSEVWQQQRLKNSKNITNLQEKIKKHNHTIDQILQLNKHEVTKQNLTMAQLFPKVEKCKNDLELIENMIYLVEDTYLELDNSGKSILLLFEHQFSNKKAQAMQKSFIQLMNKKLQQEEEDNETEPEGENENQSEDGNETEEECNNGDIPLIDEEVFTGEIDQQEIEVQNLFAESEPEKRQYLLAEKIPDGVNILEHDINSGDFDPNEFKNSQQNNNNDDNGEEDLRIYEIKEQFKNSIKDLGSQMHEQLTLISESLQLELSQLTQSISDLESSILQLHHKHAKQIVQIYMETKNLQSQIFQLDDSIMILDAQVFDCGQSDEKLQQCDVKKGLDNLVIEDLKSEKSFSIGIVKELEKLLEFEDKNVYEPEEITNINTKDIEADIEPKSQEQIEEEQENLKIQKRIKSIKDQEKIIEQQLEQQNQEEEEAKKIQEQPEHLNQVPEIQQEEQIQQKQIQETPEKKREEDQVLEEVNKQIQEEEKEGENVVQLPQIEQLEETVQPKLEFLKKNKNKK